MEKPFRFTFGTNNLEMIPNAEGFDVILAPPSMVLISKQRPSTSGLIP
jgi:hypothetical protein